VAQAFLPVTSRRLVIHCALLSATVLAGCRTARVTQPLPAEVMSNDESAQMDFWHALPDRKVVGNDEAFHALLLFLDETDPATDYDGRVRALKDRKLLPSGFNRAANDAVTRGTLAVAFARALNIKGGLTMTLFGPTERYATRELMYTGLFPSSSPNQTFSGQELVGIFGRAEDYQRTNEAAAPLKPDLQQPTTAPAAETVAPQATTNPFDSNAANPPVRNPNIPAPGAPIRE
jgi:hypothetical protein